VIFYFTILAGPFEAHFWPTGTRSAIFAVYSPCGAKTTQSRPMPYWMQ